MFTDGTTEPIIAIIGHPIAGNPSQLAIERSLHSLGLEWRVLSFDVEPENVAKALDGFSVTGIAGVMIATNLESAAADWYSEYAKTIEPPAGSPDSPDAVHADTVRGDGDTAQADDDQADEDPIDPVPVSRINCLYRNEQHQFLGADQKIAFLEERLADRSVEQALWLGELPSEDQRGCWPSQWNLFSDRAAGIDDFAERIAAANLIVLAEFDEGDLEDEDGEIDEWPANDGTTFVIDLAGKEDFVQRLTERGYTVVGCMDLQVGMLARCIWKWTQRQAPQETVADAIEEYFGV